MSHKKLQEQRQLIACFFIATAMLVDSRRLWLARVSLI